MSLQLFWRSGPIDEIYWYPIFKWASVIWLNIGHPDNNPSNVCQCGIVYHMRLVTKHLFVTHACVCLWGRGNIQQSYRNLTAHVLYLFQETKIYLHFYHLSTLRRRYFMKSFLVEDRSHSSVVSIYPIGFGVSSICSVKKSENDWATEKWIMDKLGLVLFEFKGYTLPQQISC